MAKMTRKEFLKWEHQQKAERIWRSNMDRYLESQGLLKYQNGGRAPTAAQLQAVGIQPNVSLLQNAPTPNYTVTNNDTLTTIAENTGSTPEAVLNANPNVSTFQPGMVVKTPNNQAYTQGEKNYTPSAVTPVGGLPSNAAVGATTTNPQGTNPLAPAPGSEAWRAQNIFGPNKAADAKAGMLAYSQAIAQQSRAINQTYVDPRGNIIEGNPFWQSAHTTPGTGAPQQPQYLQPQSLAMAAPIQQVSDSVKTPQSMQTMTALQDQTGRAGGRYFQELVPGSEAWRIQNAYTPWETAQQVQTVQISTPYYGYGGGGGRWYGRGGGGGRRSASPGRSNVGNNAPAFSGSGGFRGLVNWRI